MSELREKLAELEHVQWQHWAKVKSPKHSLLNVPYSQLNEEEKDKDRLWADKVLALISEHNRQGQGKLRAEMPRLTQEELAGALRGLPWRDNNEFNHELLAFLKGALVQRKADARWVQERFSEHKRRQDEATR